MTWLEHCLCEALYFLCRAFQINIPDDQRPDKRTRYGEEPSRPRPAPY